MNYSARLKMVSTRHLKPETRTDCRWIEELESDYPIAFFNHQSGPFINVLEATLLDVFAHAAMPEEVAVVIREMHNCDIEWIKFDDRAVVDEELPVLSDAELP